VKEPRPNFAELARRVRLAKKILPPLLALFVVIFELTLRPIRGADHAFWLALGFYALLGPIAVYLVLDWVADELNERARVERDLVEAYKRLEILREVVHSAIEAENLDEAMRALVEALRQGLKGEAAIQVGEYRYASAGFPLKGCTEEGVVTAKLPRTGGRLCFFGPVDPEFLQVVAGEVDAILEAAEHRTRDLLTLIQVDEALRAEANLERLLDRLLARIVDWAEAEGGAVYLLDEGGALRLWASRGEKPRPEFFVPQGAWREALKKPVFIAPGRLAVPLGDSDPVGVLVVSGEHERLRSRLPFLKLLASQVTLAVRNAQAYLRAEALAIHEERTRIAREIHDGLAQALAFMALKLDLARRLWERDPARARAEIERVQETLRQQIREVRRSIFALRPVDLERYGFVESVHRYADAFAEQAGFRLRVEVEGEPRLSKASELALFRVLQEALNNVAKHARASRVEVRLKALKPEGARLEVVDDGVGFDPAQVGEGHFGLTQMKERVLARGGQFRVESAPGKGTRIIAEVPG